MKAFFCAAEGNVPVAFIKADPRQAFSLFRDYDVLTDIG
jgi:hypothetical protein